MSVLDLIPKTEKETLKYRLLAIMIVAMAFLLEADEVPLVLVLAVVGGYLGYSYVLRTLLIPRYTSYPLLGVMLLIDVGTIVAALDIIGLDSPVFGILPIVVVYYAMYLGYSGGIAAATVSTAGYTSLVFATGQADEMRNLLAFQSFFYILALLVGYVSQQRFQETEERQSLQQLIGAEAQARRLLEVTQDLAKVMDPVTLSTDLAKMGAQVARVPFCVIFTHDPERHALVYQGSNLSEGLAALGDGEELTQPLAQDSFLSTAWNTGKVATLDGPGGADDGVARWLEKIDARRALACPFMGHGEKIGVISFVATGDTPDFSADTVDAMQAFSEIAGRFLASTQLYSQAERRSRRVAAELQQSIETAGRFRELTQRKSMRFGPLVIEPTRESVRWQETSVRLTRTEFDLLCVLAEKSGSVVNQETLTREVWGEDYTPQGKVVDVTIHRLRRKLGTLPQGQKLIRTVRGQGYSFVPPERFVGT